MNCLLALEKESHKVWFNEEVFNSYSYHRNPMLVKYKNVNLSEEYLVLCKTSMHEELPSTLDGPFCKYS